LPDRYFIHVWAAQQTQLPQWSVQSLRDLIALIEFRADIEHYLVSYRCFDPVEEVVKLIVYNRGLWTCCAIACQL
jgi:hypothetical protein